MEGRCRNNTVSFETYQKTRSIAEAERKQRWFEWQVNSLIGFLKQGKLEDTYDLLIAGLLVKQNHTTDNERKYFDRVLKEIGLRGYAREEQELRWRLQNILKLRGDS